MERARLDITKSSWGLGSLYGLYTGNALALKYHNQPEKGLIVNTNPGGDNAHCGAVLGALLVAANGLESFPDHG